MTTKDCLEIIKYLNYNPDTGMFTWDRPGSQWHGLRAGNFSGRGYWNIRVNKKPYQAHRLAWYLMYGKIPTIIDHINGIKDDNRLSNLREVTLRENSQNHQKHRNGKLVGACYIPKRRKWSASIYVHGKQKRLGYFKTEQEAHEAYMKALSSV